MVETGSRSLWVESSTRPAGHRQELVVCGEKYGFCWIPPGEFVMGSSKAQESSNIAETPRHVKLDCGFWLLETPVTQGFYEQITGSNPSFFKNGNTLLPVEHVDYNDALNFCKILTQYLPEGVTADIPTEAQWEYSCRAGTSKDFNAKGGFNFDCYHESNAIIIDGRVLRTWDQRDLEPSQPWTTPVKRYTPNDWGLYDMHGNVEEICKDRYAAAEVARIKPGVWDGHVGDFFVARGGCCFDQKPSLCSCSSRCFIPIDYNLPSKRDCDSSGETEKSAIDYPVKSAVGFRVMLYCK